MQRKEKKEKKKPEAGKDSSNCSVTAAGNSCVAGFLSCGRFCISPDMRCNGIPNCPDGRDERGCPRGTGAAGTHHIGNGHTGGSRGRGHGEAGHNEGVVTRNNADGQPGENNDKTGDTAYQKMFSFHCFFLFVFFLLLLRPFLRPLGRGFQWFRVHLVKEVGESVSA